MTRKEAAHLADMQRELRETRALRFTDMPEPERMEIPEEGYVNGWEFNPQFDGRVYPIWSEKDMHGWEHRSDDSGRRGAAPSGIRPFATRRDALTALRIAKERDFARRLAEIDAEIEKARAAEAGA